MVGVPKHCQENHHEETTGEENEKIHGVLKVGTHP